MLGSGFNIEKTSVFSVGAFGMHSDVNNLFSAPLILAFPSIWR